MSKVIFDVGANDGSTFLGAARNGNIVYAFEPVPELLSSILGKLRDNPCPSYYLIAAAISDEETITKFNIAAWHDWGCSSLNEFSDDLDRSNAPFVSTHHIFVPTIRMDTFIRKMNISKIDYLHVDTQGNDLRVLRSFGDELHRIVSGVIEVPNLVHLYKNTPSKQEAIDFLENNGFIVTRIENNNGDPGEQNIFFERKTI